MDSPAWARQPGPRLEIVPPARDSSGFCSQDSGGVGALLRRVTVPKCSEHWTSGNCSELKPLACLSYQRSPLPHLHSRFFLGLEKVFEK